MTTTTAPVRTHPAAAALVALFGDPISTRMHALADRADLVHATQTELRTAATGLATRLDQLTTKTSAVTEHWQGSAAEQFAHKASSTTHRLTTTAEMVAAADTLVDNALGAVRTGHTTIARLLDEYTAKGNQVVAAATKLMDAGQHGALISATGYLSTLAGQYTTEADTAYRTAHAALTNATAEFALLDKQFPAKQSTTQQKSSDTHPESTTTTAHHTTASHHPTANHTTATHHTTAHHTTAHHKATAVHIGHGLGDVTAPNAAAATAVRSALSQLGVPYVWGGESPGHAFDCSGLTAYAYGKAGISLPHYASSQRIGKKVSESDLKPGDLVIFSGHVTMYIGKGHVVAAPHTGTDVQIEPLFTSIPGDPFLGFYRPSVQA